MKMYARFDTVRQKFHRSRYDGSEEYTKNPSDLSSDKARVERKGKLLETNHKRYGKKGPKPKFVIREFEIAL